MESVRHRAQPPRLPKLDPVTVPTRPNGDLDRLRLALVERAILADRVIGGLACTLQAVVRGALCRALPERLHGEATRRVFDDAGGWGAGGHEFEKRLFSWEEEFFRENLPGGGDVLVGGVGGGRELLGLAELGCAAYAFEPSDLVQSAQGVAAECGMPDVRRAAYTDLRPAVEGRGPLAGLPYDRIGAMVLGWGSFCHLTTRTGRIDALSALRTLLPAAPVLYSFNWRGPDDRPYTDRGRLRFDPELGYFTALQWEDIDDEAAAAGYTVTRRRSEPAPHAWLKPR